jgi:PKD domain
MPAARSHEASPPYGPPASWQGRLSSPILRGVTGRTVLTVAVIVGALGVFTGCGSGERQLDVLELEELASFVAPGGTIEAQQESDGGEIARVFAYDESAAARAGRQAAIEAARASGWELTFEDGEPGDPIFGAKRLSTGDLTLVIGQYEEGDLVKISIRLEHGACGKCVPGGRVASSSPRAEQETRPGEQQSAGLLDDPSSVPGTILVLPSRPNAWAGGPYVAALGDTRELDGSGSYDSDGRIVRYEWDLDGDGDYEISTTEATTRFRFTEPLDGMLTLRVTDDDGKTHVARVRVHASIDGDESEPPADNCPTVANHGQSDWDEDGVGDACDPTPFGG